MDPQLQGRIDASHAETEEAHLEFNTYQAQWAANRAKTAQVMADGNAREVCTHATATLSIHYAIAAIEANYGRALAKQIQVGLEAKGESPFWNEQIEVSHELLKEFMHGLAALEHLYDLLTGELSNFLTEARQHATEWQRTLDELSREG